MLGPGRWASFHAEQWFEATRCAFCWHARVKMMPLVTAVVEDAYEDGHGRLEAKLFGAIPLMKAERGVELDRGELQRYLGELPWNPMAILHNPNLSFASGPGDAERVWAHGDPETHLDCRFDASGDLVEVTTSTRMRTGVGVQPWSARFLAYGERDSVRVPVEAEVSWDPPSGREVYWRGRVLAFEWR